LSTGICPAKNATNLPRSILRLIKGLLCPDRRCVLRCCDSHLRWDAASVIETARTRWRFQRVVSASTLDGSPIDHGSAAEPAGARIGHGSRESTKTSIAGQLTGIRSEE